MESTKCRIIEMLESNHTPKEIKRKVGCSESYISMCRKNIGMPSLKRGKSPLKIQSKIFQLIKQKLRPVEIVRRLQCSQSYVSLCRRRLGIKPWDGCIGSRPHPDRNVLLKMKQSGKTYAQIAAMRGVTRQCIQQSITRGMNFPTHGVCADCKEKKPLVTHHENYWPEKVRHICFKCHGNIHGGERAKKFKLDGKPITMLALARKAGITLPAMIMRLRRMSVEQAIGGGAWSKSVPRKVGCYAKALNESKVIEIRRRRKEETEASLALDYKVTVGTINHVVNRITWAHVP